MRSESPTEMVFPPDEETPTLELHTPPALTTSLSNLSSSTTSDLDMAAESAYVEVFTDTEVELLLSLAALAAYQIIHIVIFLVCPCIGLLTGVLERNGNVCWRSKRLEAVRGTTISSPIASC